MIVLDLIDREGILAGAASVDEGLAASSFGFLRAVAAARGFDVQQGYADTDHPSMNVYSGEDWMNFVRSVSYPDAAAPSALAAQAPAQSGSTCTSSLFLQVGHLSDGTAICAYWPGVLVPVAAMGVAALLGAGGWWVFGIGVAAYYLTPRPATADAPGSGT